MPVITITGKNNFQAQQELRSRREAFVSEYGDSGISEIHASDTTIGLIQEAATSQGLFSSASFVVLRDIASNKHLQEQLPDVLDAVPSETTLVIFEPALDRRTSFFKYLQKNSEFIDCKELDERAAVAWVQSTFKEMGGEIGFGEAQFLAQRVQFNQWLLYNELQKLLDVEGPITRSVIEQYVDESFNDSIFNLLDDAFAKRGDKALESYRQMLANKVEAHYVFSMLVWQLHILLVAAWGSGTDPDQLARDNKLSPFVVKKSIGLARQTSKPDLKKLVSDAIQIDFDSKTRAGYDIDAAVDMFIAQIAS